MKAILQELGGLVNTSTISAIEQPIQFTGEMHQVMPLCSKMRPWQREIYVKLNNNDLYIAASPGAGKTLPYLCWWMQQVLQLETRDAIIYKPSTAKNYIKSIANLILTPEKVGKLVVLVPIRSLAEQTLQEFRVIFSQVLATVISNYMSGILKGLFATTVAGQQNPFVNKQVQVISFTLINKIDSNLIPRFKGRSKTADALKKAQDRNDIESIRIHNRDLESHDKTIEQMMVNSIKKFVDDELIAIRTGLGAKGDPDKAPVTVSIYESASSYIKDIADRVQLLVCDESHLIQDKEVKVRQDVRSFSIAAALYKVLKRLKRTQYRLLFLSGTANPGSAKNLKKYLDECFNRNVEVIETPGAGNPSNITIHTDNSIKDFKNLAKIVKSGQHGTAIIVFSKNGIKRLAEDAIKQINPKSLPQIQGGSEERYKFRSTLGGATRHTGGTGTFPNRSPQDLKLDPMKIGAKSASMDLDAAKIHDQLLRQAVQAGFGYIYRLDEEEKEFHQRKSDNQIVADLFTKGKIRVLLATDAVGVGVNIKVRTLIIPTTEKPTGPGRREQMDPATLAQLLHRAGRGTFMFAKVVTTDEDAARIANALSLTPEGFTGGAVISGKLPPFACRTIKFFVDFWRAL